MQFSGGEAPSRELREVAVELMVRQRRGVPVEKMQNKFEGKVRASRWLRASSDGSTVSLTVAAKKALLSPSLT